MVSIKIKELTTAILKVMIVSKTLVLKEIAINSLFAHGF